MNVVIAALIAWVLIAVLLWFLMGHIDTTVTVIGSGCHKVNATTVVCR